MAKFDKYVEYLKNNPEGYWFKRKLFGWGWTPVKWQGWVVILVYVICLIAAVLIASTNSVSKDVPPGLILSIIVFTIILIAICYKKGEKPRWQWGLPDKE